VIPIKTTYGGVSVYIVAAGPQGSAPVPVDVFWSLRAAKAYVWREYRIRLGNQWAEGRWRGELGSTEVRVLRCWVNLPGGAS
jgi:hypothetical protein